MITIDQIKPNNQFKLSNGVIFIIDSIDTADNTVRTSTLHGDKGMYRDSIADCVDFFNEENATIILK